MKCYRLPCLAILGTFLSTQPASAEPIRVQGFFTIDFPVDYLDRGAPSQLAFDLAAEALTITARFNVFFGDAPIGPFCDPCSPGMMISASGFHSTFEGVSATVGGVTYVSPRASFHPYWGSITHSSAIMIPALPPADTFSLPFLFDFGPGGLVTDGIGYELTGEGTGFVTFARDASTGEFRVRSARYELQDGANPIPEPGSLLMTSAGLAVLARWRRRKLRRKDM